MNIENFFQKELEKRDEIITALSDSVCSSIKLIDFLEIYLAKTIMFTTGYSWDPLQIKEIAAVKEELGKSMQKIKELLEESE